MRIADMNWRMVEAYLKRDDRIVLPLGCTEQHAHLSLATDSIQAERVAVEAAEPLGVPVLPAVPYGITPQFRAYPGTVHVRVHTYLSFVRDILESLADQGFRRILIVNGHGGNSPVQSLALEWMGDRPGVQVRVHNWWNAPKVWAKVQAIDPVASHASWMENFPWTRLAAAAGAEPPAAPKAPVDLDRLRGLPPAAAREYLGDGNFGGAYARSDEDMLAVWRVGVEETRAAIEGPWLR